MKKAFAMLPLLALLLSTPNTAHASFLDDAVAWLKRFFFGPPVDSPARLVVVLDAAWSFSGSESLDLLVNRAYAETTPQVVALVSLPPGSQLTVLFKANCKAKVLVRNSRQVSDPWRWRDDSPPTTPPQCLEAPRNFTGILKAVGTPTCHTAVFAANDFASRTRFYLDFGFGGLVPAGETTGSTATFHLARGAYVYAQTCVDGLGCGPITSMNYFAEVIPMGDGFVF